jgi:hypothetical protein
MRAARLKELEEMAAKLLETAHKLLSGQERHNALQEIERFRARITALQRLDLSGMAQSPQPYDLVTRPCTIHAGRFRWDVRENKTYSVFRGIVRHRAGNSRGRSP